jgi:hypothetical protein
MYVFLEIKVAASFAKSSAIARQKIRTFFGEEIEE